MEPDVWLEDGEELSFGDMSLRMIATPGHTVGSCCYHFAEEGVLICGDTLFQGSVGRTDLSTGDGRQLISSIKDKLLTLPEDTRCYPGHGEPTTIGEEKRYNPFLSADGYSFI